jgi:hypothetical protein
LEVRSKESRVLKRRIEAQRTKTSTNACT